MQLVGFFFSLAFFFLFGQIRFPITKNFVPNQSSSGVSPETAPGVFSDTAGLVVNRRLTYFTGETGISSPWCTSISDQTRAYNDKIWVGSQLVVPTSISFNCWSDWCTWQHRCNMQGVIQGFHHPQGYGRTFDLPVSLLLCFPPPKTTQTYMWVQH